MTTREADEDRVQAKQEENHETRSTAKAAAATAPGSSWSRLKDPRIVRVSRAFGGKDRHSKVCTVRGLRDRRVRLSVPTAIQLYDLQDRLGLNQPSKVVDWLLNVAKNEIDELPPLPDIPPPGSFGPNLGQPIVAPPPPHHQSNSELASLLDQTEPSGSNNAWHSDALFRPKSSKGAVDSSEEKESWTRNESSYFSSNNFFSRLDHHSSSPSSLGLMNSSTMQYNSLIRWDPSNLSLSQSGSPGMAAEDFHNFGLVPLPSSVPSIPTGSQQVLVYHQPGGTHATQPYFPSHIAAASDYSAGGGRQFHLLSTATKLHASQNGHQEKQDGENGFQSR